MQTVSTSDIGRTAAACLLDRRDGERILNLLGPDEYSPHDLAAAFTEVLGRAVEAVPVAREELLPALLEAGIGADYARCTVEVYDGLNSGWIEFEPGVGETRRGSVTLVEAVRRMMSRGEQRTAASTTGG